MNRYKLLCRNSKWVAAVCNDLGKAMSTLSFHKKRAIQSSRKICLQRALEDKDELNRVLADLAPVQPEQDYDRYERWASGFRSRLRRLTRIDLSMYSQDFVDGWNTCNEFLG